MIERTMRGDRCACGATGLRPDRRSLGIVATMAAMLPAIWLCGVDGGVVFCRREDFHAVKGYDEGVLASEDLRLLFDLIRLGDSRWPRRRFGRPHGVKTITSTRKFDERGDWHYFPLMIRGMLTALAGRDRFNEFARGYWYTGRGE
jgi:hypothetical protein